MNFTDENDYQQFSFWVDLMTLQYYSLCKLVLDPNIPAGY